MLVPAEVWNVVQREGDNHPIVLIRPVGSQIALPILIDGYQASSILLGLENKRIEDSQRPHTHDLFVDVLDKLGAKLMRVEITSLQRDTFYGKLILQRPEEDESSEPVAVDSRPSDCLALAVRTGCPLYVDEELVEREGRIYEVEGDNITAVSQGKNDLRFLEERLKIAVESEDYEEAARLRDMIREQRRSNG